jgi:choline kinase
VQFLNQIYQERIVMKCLIIAAGQGTRLRTKCEVKPLVRLLGVPLIERVIRTTMQSGVWEFYVVTGYQGEKVGSFLKQLAKRLNIAVTIIHNEDWKKENGVSVLKAKDAMMEPFLLLMADHLLIRLLFGHYRDGRLTKARFYWRWILIRTIRWLI